MSWSAPHEPLAAAFWTAKLAISDLIGGFTRRFLLTADQEAERGEFLYSTPRSVKAGPWRTVPLVDSGCRPPATHGEVVGREVILAALATVVTD